MVLLPSHAGDGVAESSLAIVEDAGERPAKFSLAKPHPVPVALLQQCDSCTFV
jgi:hypothetical protein